MPRDLSSLRRLPTAADLVAFLREDAADRVLLCADDLGPDDEQGDSVLVVRSMRALGADSLRGLVKAIRREDFPPGARPGEIAVVGVPGAGGVPWAVPADVEALLNESEGRLPKRLLYGTPYEGMWVLADHPEADWGHGLHGVRSFMTH